MKAERPPVLARWVADKLGSRPSEGLLGDLEEEFHSRADRIGGLEAARIAYRRDVFRSLLPLLCMRGRFLVSSGLTPGLVGSTVSVCWFLAAYGIIASLAEQGGRPLGDLPTTVFLGVWVFGSAAVGGLAAGWFRPAAAESARLVVGLFAATFVLVGIDAPTPVSGELAIGAAALAGAVIGAGLGARRSTPIPVA